MIYVYMYMFASCFSCWRWVGVAVVLLWSGWCRVEALSWEKGLELAFKSSKALSVYTAVKSQIASTSKIRNEKVSSWKLHIVAVHWLCIVFFLLFASCWFMLCFVTQRRGWCGRLGGVASSNFRSALRWWSRQQDACGASEFRWSVRFIDLVSQCRDKQVEETQMEMQRLRRDEH